ncbi:MAG: NAD(P)H-hydrate epimerase, partial [Synergistaceae bacterium]|nr:NAD(P)H-hydrate epimerase [Synergistaceae bacterium]
MIRYYSSEAVRNADRLAADKLGLPGEVLMENAGRGAAEIIAARYPGAKNVLILCGHGNNGGDGLVAARHLSLAGKSPVVLAMQAVEEYKNEAAYAAISAKNSGVTIIRSEETDDSEITSLVMGADVMVDALLGTGSNGAPRGEAERLIKLSSSHAHMVALDVPSGVNADTGEVYDAAVKAELTVTFLAGKPGLAIAPGTFQSGEAVVTGIGVDPEAVLSHPPSLTGWDASDIPLMMPAISPGIHKGSRGALLIIGGAPRYRGAPVLAALGALHAGCGLVALAIPESLVASAAALVPEAIFIPLPQERGHISFEGFKNAVAPIFEKFDAVTLGPGIGRSAEAEQAARFVYGECAKPLIIDADALRFGYGFRRNNVVVTPHAGEAAHILGTTPTEVGEHRLESCGRLAGVFGTALLKGPRTLVSDG